MQLPLFSHCFIYFILFYFIYLFLFFLLNKSLCEERFSSLLFFHDTEYYECPTDFKEIMGFNNKKK